MIRAKIIIPVLLLAAGLFFVGSTAEARPVYFRPAPCPAPICAPAPIVAAPCAPPVVTHYRAYRPVHYRAYHRGYRR